MSHHKLWKEVSHIKGSEVADNQSFISHSKSSASYQFSHIKFSKIVDEKDKKNKKALHLESVLRAKSKNQTRNTEYRAKKTSRENSISSLIDKQPIDLTLKLKFYQNIESKLKHFILNIKQIHNQLKELAESMVITFEQMKEDFEGNLVNVTDEMMKMNGEMQNVEKIHEILHNGFESIRKGFVLPLESLSQLNGLSQESIGNHKSKDLKRHHIVRQAPLTPHLKANNKQTNGTNIIYSSAFSSQLISPKAEFKLSKLNLQSISKSKARAETERKKNEQNKLGQKEPEDMTERKKNEMLTLRSTQSTQNIECIINQMREILND